MADDGSRRPRTDALIVRLLGIEFELREPWHKGVALGALVVAMLWVVGVLFGIFGSQPPSADPPTLGSASAPVQIGIFINFKILGLPAPVAPPWRASSTRGSPVDGVFRWNVTDFATTDRRSRPVRVQVGHISGPFGWSLGAVDRIQIGAGPARDLALAELVSYLGASENRPVIAVGMASHEGAVATEEERAQARSNNLAAQAMRHLTQAPKIGTLNLGRRVGNTVPDQQSVYERPVALAVVIEGADSPDLPRVIGDALVRAHETQRFPIDARDYSRFQRSAESFQWVKN